jgi:hypothetical protein
LAKHLHRHHQNENLTFEKTKKMETVIKINTDLLNLDIIEGIKKMFPHKTVEISIQPSDDTEYILQSPSYAAEIQERIEKYKTQNNTVKLNPDELL